MISDTPLSAKAHRVFKTTTEPAVEPVSSDEIKLFARIDGTDEDNLISALIKDVRIAMENYLGRSLVEQTLTMLLDYWPGNVLQLPKPPLLSVASVATLDENDAATVYSASNYFIVNTAVPGEIILRQGITPPQNTIRDYRGYRVIWTAGYGSQASNVPSAIRTAMMQWATMIYENRTAGDLIPPEISKRVSAFRITPHVYRS